ncbi:7905_t:CDS:2, partial [Racocetra fulgida]
LAIKHVENYVIENGFEVVKYQTQKNKGGEIDQITKNQVHYKPIEVANDIEFAEDSYELVITNLNLLIKCIDRFTIQEVWRVMTIEQNKEHFVIIYKNANWIKKTERKIHYNLNKPDKENLPNISNPYLTHTKGTPKKHIKSAFENSISKYQSKGKTYTATKN